MLYFQALVLGIAQGLTEFIPISSSAHLIIIPWLLGWQTPALTSLPFDVALHMGTLLAVLVFFAADWWRLLRAGLASVFERKIGADPDRRQAWLLVIATIPGGVAGVLFESKIEALFHQAGKPVTMAAMIAMAIIIAALGLILWLADRLARHTRKLGALTLKDAIIIGCSQAFSVFPGISRSGSTISAGLALGLERDAAARFSFLLSAPIVAGAGLKSLWEVIGQLHSGALTSSDLMLFFIGFVFAALSGFMCIKLLLHYLQRNSITVFAIYRWALALLVIAVAVARG